MSIHVGSAVSFKSPGKGGKKIKVGVVIQLVQPHALPQLSQYYGVYDFKNINAARTRCQVSYLVHVKRGKTPSGKESTGRPYIYWPYPNAVELVPHGTAQQESTNVVAQGRPM